MADPASSTTATTGGAVDKPVPEIFDPYLGRAYGNVLDLYDNATYNIKLAVIRDLSVVNTAQGNASASGGTTTTANPRADTPTGNSSTSGGTTSASPAPAALGRTQPVKPGDQIIIAQTGVTGIVIDNLTIVSNVDDALNYWPMKIEFDLIQPGAANLIDQMQIARKWLKVESTSPQFLMSLEVSFMGRSADPDDEDKGGAPVLVDGPYGWIIAVNSIEINVDQTGSKYHFIATPTKNILYNDRDFRIPVEIKCTGSTVQESVDSFKRSLNTYLKETCPAEWVGPDEYVFDTSRLLGSSQPLLPPNSPLRSPSDPDTNPASAVSSGGAAATDKANDAPAANTLVNTGQAEITYKEGSWMVPAKTDFYNFFIKLLSICDNFVNGATNLENINNPTSKTIKKAALSWISVEMDVEYVKYDKVRNDYQKKIIVRPVIYETVRPDLDLKLLGPDDTDQQSRNQENAATFKLQKLRKEKKLLKSYKYLFTGLNDQILNLNLKFDNGYNLLLPPRNGMIGDTELITAPMLNPTQPLNADLSTARGLLGLVDKARDAAKFASVLKSMTEGQIGNIAKSLGITAAADIESLKNSIKSGTTQAAEELRNKLSARTLNQAANSAAEAERAAAAGSGNNNVKNPDGTPYKPESSGATYAEDLLTDIMERAGGLTLQQILDAGLIRASDLGPNPYEMRPPATVDSTPASSGPATSMISKRASPTNVLFNYMYTKHSTRQDMIALDMSIRGDPWYLGSARDKSTEKEAALSASNESFILLQVATPPPFDLDLNDEDNNTGYWNMNGLSNSFSGVYKLLKVENKFQNGVFTTSLTGSKDFMVPLHKIRPLEPGKPASDFGGIEFDANGNPIRTDAETNLANNLVRAPRPGSTTGGGNPGGAGGGPGSPGVTGSNKPVAANSTGFAHPLGDAKGLSVTSDFGPRAAPTPGASRDHKGLDIGAPAGTRIFATAGGTVTRAVAWDGTSAAGNYIEIDHGLINGQRVTTRYLHMIDAPTLRVGDPVSPGALVGGVGSTGRSTGNHLHYEVRINGVPQDPEPYIKR